MSQARDDAAGAAAPRCDACLRIGGPSAGADRMVAVARALGKRIYLDPAEVP